MIFMAYINIHNSYIQNILIDACKNPSLIQLFHLYSYFPTVEGLENVNIFILIDFLFSNIFLVI